jgi:trehalose 6-phosphate synthase
MTRLLRVSSRLVLVLTVVVAVVSLLSAAMDVQSHLEQARAALGSRANSAAGQASIDALRSSIWREAILRAIIQVVVIVGFTFLIARWSVAGPIAHAARWMREFRLGQSANPPPAVSGMLQPLAQEMTHLVTSLETARATAAEEARLRDAGESRWTAERLRAHVRVRLTTRPLFVVSNREPYMHMRRGGGTEVLIPASGVVTALEPVLRACEGTWVAHGSGDADRDKVDANDRVRVPPENPSYTLRRVWLSREEEEGYYYGFSNEGLWPLCHIAHTRPVFRASDYTWYEQVNQKFARAVLEEMTGAESPIVLIQDYHFALLPRLVKAERPDAQVAVFWHIPWPNPEAFGICPWQTNLLDGLLGADLVGFHTQAHCNNFLETVDRAFESQIEWERFAVRRAGHLTAVRPFPISVEFCDRSGEAPRPIPQASDLLAPFKIAAPRLGIGVDRIDYTKGLVERFAALERFFERWPEYRGQFTFVQIAAPSRTAIKRYQDLVDSVENEAARINRRFQTDSWAPIVLLVRHHHHKEIEPYYRAASVCLVTSLHDGMNLVAKEFVASRDDGDGVLILSRFAGASEELDDALVVNPYDTEQLAEALHVALTMSEGERHLRMHRMRETIREHNVFRWAGRLIADLAAIRVASNGHTLSAVGRGRVESEPHSA